MADIIQFVSRSESDAQENLDEFIRIAQFDLTGFADGGAWDDLAWRNDRVSVVFCKHRPRADARKSPVPLGEPFLSFAKAYFRYRYSHKPVTSAGDWMVALRLVELALIDSAGRADIKDLGIPILDVSATLCSQLLKSKDSHYRIGRQIEALADFCRQHRLVAQLPAWKCPFKRQPVLTETLTQDGVKHRESKLPTNSVMLALADLFAQADDVESRYFTSIMMLMMVAPSRVSEVLSLPVDCIGWEEDSEGAKQMYLRWRAAKGGGPMKKWVPAAMQTVVEEAVSRLHEIGSAAREAAKFAFENPSRFMQHPACTTPSSLSEDDPLSPAQIAAAIGVNPEIGGSWARLPPAWAKLHDAGPVTYRVLADETARRYKSPHWPHINAQREVLVWDALCIAREFEYHRDFSARPFSWRVAGSGEINDRLDGREEFSLFERNGVKDTDGAPIKLTTHQLRHWLSTMSARAGMDDYTLARWAGRARIEDNRHYDHRTQEERSGDLRALLRTDEPATLEKFRGHLPVTYNELGVDRPGTAKATLYGMCVHDYAMAPCQKQRDCMTCKEHVCIKGDHLTLDRIKTLEEMTAALLEKAREATLGGDFGADRWVDHHAWKLAHVRTMRTQLEAQSLPDGAVLRIPDEYDPSPVRRTLMDLDLIDEPTSADIPAAIAVRAIEGPKDA